MTEYNLNFSTHNIKEVTRIYKRGMEKTYQLINCLQDVLGISTI